MRQTSGEEGPFVPWSILQRYVLGELVRVFALALVAITGILVMAGIVAEAAQQGFGPAQILAAVPLLIPGFLPFTVPATTLFAVSVVYGRLSHDNELTAVKASGIPILRMVGPAFLVGVVLSAILLLLYLRFIPATHHRLRVAAVKDIEELIYTLLRKDLCFNKPDVNYSIYVKEVQGRRLMTATFKKRDQQGRDEIIAQAREAEIQVDLEKEEVNILMIHGNIIKDGGGEAFFEKHTFPVPLPPIGLSRKVRARELSMEQIRARQRQLLDDQEAVRAGRPVDRKGPDGKPRDAVWHLLPREMQLKNLHKEFWELETEFQARPALALSCLFFTLVGVPVGVWVHKRDYLSSFVTCFLPIVIVYYPLMMFGINLGKEGKLDPAYSMWVGNAVLGLAGLILLWRLVRR